jgi:FkbM family methyltransferase
MKTRVLDKKTSRWLQNYYKGPNHPFKLRLWHWIWSRLGEPRLTVPYADRGWITLDIHDWLQGKIFQAGYYEREVWDRLSAYAASGESVWDVGAHIGSFSIRAGLDPRVAEVHAFEPDPLQGQVLAVNLPLNSGCYMQYPIALSNKNEKRKLYHGLPGNTGLSSLDVKVSDMSFEVDCRTLDDMVFKDGVRAPSLMKVDVEGWELQVLQGAERVLHEYPPKAMVLECECDSKGRILEPRVVEQLEKAHYRIERIVRPSGIIDERENYLAIHRKAA